MTKATNVTSSLDVEVVLSAKLGGVKTLQKYVEVKEEKGGENAIVKAKGALPYTTWLQINRAIREIGGVYKRRENLWIVSLKRKSE